MLTEYDKKYLDELIREALNDALSEFTSYVETYYLTLKDEFIEDFKNTVDEKL